MIREHEASEDDKKAVPLRTTDTGDIGVTYRGVSTLTDVVKELNEKYPEQHPLFLDPVLELLPVIRQFGGETDSTFSLRGKDVLDIGCGSLENNEMRSEENGREGAWQPWFARALLVAGAKPVGIDRGPNSEAFPIYDRDLSAIGSLRFLDDASFDAVHAQNIFPPNTSPSLIRSISERIGYPLPQGQSDRINHEHGALVKPDEDDPDPIPSRLYDHDPRLSRASHAPIRSYMRDQLIPDLLGQVARVLKDGGSFFYEQYWVFRKKDGRLERTEAYLESTFKRTMELLDTFFSILHP